MIDIRAMPALLTARRVAAPAQVGAPHLIEDFAGALEPGVSDAGRLHNGGPRNGWSAAGMRVARHHQHDVRPAPAG